MTYNIDIKSEVKKYLLTLDKALRQRISRNINQLAANPRPAGCKKLKTIDAYRIRVGDYRVIYEIKDATLIILVVKIAHRREAYGN